MPASEYLFNYKQYVPGKPYSDENLLRIYMEHLMPQFKLSLYSFVGTEDDLGPEVILNLKTLDVYRYQ